MYSVKLKSLALMVLLFASSTAMAMTDPMQPPAYQDVKPATVKKSVARWELTSTLIASDRRLATINGKTLGVGKMIDGAKIIDIQPAVVTLNYQNRSIVLKLISSVVKRQRIPGVE